ncbi:ATP-binding protein [Aliiruegeria lutimaris]|uniref:histidine kinase n=1 Tax=Aliiruegeria lutimaris TaxID=571298 RepID=A0A1G9GB44_9RHOB|nr:ATP-binding protein [Aliiruegeria lutimaris]SDK97842.1 two-component system, OmpR family, osmolarity sensor histidine kinase EnvZ [Aliiruegeria lutimaris]
MKFGWLKRSMPRGLYGRAALILIVPIAVLILVVSAVFIQRHFEDVTRQLTNGVVLELREIIELIDEAPDMEAGMADIASLVDTLNMEIFPAPEERHGVQRVFYDVSGLEVIKTLRDGFDDVRAVDLSSSSRWVQVQIGTTKGPVDIRFRRQRASASNPHQFLVLMATIGVLMASIAFLYLRNQLRPITRLADAAEAFGKGQVVHYKTSGALEVRAAGRAFLDMRGRILRQIEQRTLMLSGVSHDLRTPLTRMKLTLSMMPEDEETADLKQDVDEMEMLIDAFLDFARSDQLGDPEPVVPQELARQVVDKAQRLDGSVTLWHLAEERPTLILRRAAVERALSNLIGNAIRYAGTARVSVELTERRVIFSVEDDGPGIPEELCEEALKPFSRLDAARNQNRGSGVGLGLAIAQDIARRHGGTLRLGVSEEMGGLKAELVLAR